MSTHVMDASGQRGLSMTLNDPARTGASIPAKPGDDVSLSVGSAREIRLQILPGARIERRRYTTQKPVYENGKVKRDEGGGFVYEEGTEERLILVLTSGLTVFARTSHISDGEEAKPASEQWPHTSLSVKRWGDELHFLESGTLVEEAVNLDRVFAPEVLEILTADEPGE